MRINAHGLAFVVTLALGVLGLVFIPSCGSTDASTFGSGDGGDGEGGDGDNVPGFNTDGGVTSNYKCPGCPDFPPIGAPMCAPAVLGPAVLSYPTDGLLLPPNMNVLEVQFVPPPGATLFEVDFENADTNVKVETKCAQVPDVRAGASRGCGITLPQGAWNDIANANRDKDPLHVTVRATVDETCVTTSTAKIDINFSRDDLSGGIYYWQSATFGGVGGKTGGIYLHDFGTLDPTPTPFFVAGTQDGGTGTCVGCHTLSRDGLRMAVMTDDPDGDDALGDSKMHTMDVPSVSIIGGRNVSPGFQAFTHDHAKMIAATFKDHMNTSFDVFDGDGTTLLGNAALPVSMKATQPDLSRDDQTLLYVVPAAGSISNTGDMHFFGGSLYTSAFDNANNTLSAPAAVLVSAGDRNFYYPSFTPDKTFIILNDAPQPGNTATTNNDSFYNRNARVKILHYPAGGSPTPIDLPNLNVADGLTNSWPRWSPFVQSFHGKKILWVTFSSNRDYGLHLVNKGFDNCYPPEGPTYDLPSPLSKQGVTYADCAQPQIWMAAVIVDPDPGADATDRSFPAFWLPFQDVNSHNHSAQWVEKVAGTPGGDGGACGDLGASCNANCCPDLVCCGGLCELASTCVK